jgi:thioredoxin-like negative regulator of GroEL
MSDHPMLLFFGSTTEGLSRRAEGYLAQVLQRRGNHETFQVRRVAREKRPDLLDRFRVAATPTILVVQENKVRARLVQPRGAAEIRAFLTPWLR